MKSLQILTSAVALSFILSACGGSGDPESSETANNSEQETIVSNDGETSETPADENNGQQDNTESQNPVIVPPAPVVESNPTPPAETVTPTNPSQPSDPVVTTPVENDTATDPAPEENAGTTDPVEEPVADNTDPAPEEPAAPAANTGAPHLNSATVSGDQVILSWSNDFDAPEGGFDVVIDTRDSGADRTHALTAAISGLDLTTQHCFLIESRYTDSSVFLRSNEVCSEAQAAANEAPTISGTPAASVDAGVAYSFTPVADDADNDSLSFSVTNLPAWASFNSSSGRLTGTPSTQDVGDYNNIRISVSDGTDSANLASFSIRVNSVQVAATTGSMSLNWVAPTTRTDGTSLNLSDISGYQIYIGTSPTNLQMHLDLGQGELSSYTIDDIGLGDYYVAITAYDRSGNSSDLSNIVQKSVVN
ncbi:MAG: Ig domain-containing protein [Candidatus Thiodiazotropha weberae]|nr:Ig domain-containing protein [Candidatus Thiodiazotropha lotti]MCG7989611.1 Ig domain-containing protein [Candidatus Thiodiazotropha lotti]MCG8012000.1 Ig domain-containing protein [Candidatus Thiodiazotropha lotti]MCG8021310.1 Ig domain-containing protein [Candidatus Thiodiazotropha lotti]MCW4208478.1 Ig domain-containing protein [Candidatus Thiodiazotropha lotti]